MSYRYRYPKFIPIPDTDTWPEIHSDTNTDISHFPTIPEVLQIPDTDTLTFIPNHTDTRYRYAKFIPIPIPDTDT